MHHFEPAWLSAAQNWFMFALTILTPAGMITLCVWVMRDGRVPLWKICGGGAASLIASPLMPFFSDSHSVLFEERSSTNIVLTIVLGIIFFIGFLLTEPALSSLKKRS
jgi:hypothetical protein